MDRITPSKRSENMRRIKSAGMKPELLVRKLVHKLGGRFRLHRHDLPGRPDLVFPSRRKIIFVHGCFWHQHAGCQLAHRPRSNLEYWEKKLARNVARDEQNVRELKRQGWRVLIVWECETRNVVGLRKKLKRFLKIGSSDAKCV